MINKAKEKIEAAASGSDNLMMKMLSRQIIENITTDEIAERILAENKNLEGCKKAFDEYASKNRKVNQSVITPEKAEELIYEYFGIKKEMANTKTSSIINILDFVK
ncbi:MAG: hypothetical protein PHV32_17540 [Eubacteriales bacterium]|nr:hypothetical protein [Eubacteriales bacterium]